MNRIFFIHSNILVICCYQTVKACIARNEKVTIITNRGCSWPFFEGNVKVYDFTEIFQGEDKRNVALHSLNALKDYKRYRAFLSHLDNVINEIVGQQEFIFYLPSMDLVMASSFVYNKYCRGYYYVDEGYLAYIPVETLQRFVPNRTRNFFKSFLRLENHYHLEKTPKFKGTISITEEAFVWNTSGERIVNSVNDYIEEVKDKIPVFDDVILTEYLTQDFEIIKKSIDYVVEVILINNPDSKIGIKIHPHAIVYNEEQTKKVINYLEGKYAKVITIIPVNVSIEVMSIVHHPNLYSLLELSSIILYAIIFKSSITKLIDYKDNAAIVKDIETVEDYHENATLD